jgi:hypothetical protein
MNNGPHVRWVAPGAEKPFALSLSKGGRPADADS